MTEKPPHRRFRLDVQMEADTMGELIQLVLALEAELTLEKIDLGTSVSGGPSGGWVVVLTEDPGQTPERFREQLKEYVESIRREKNP